MGTPTSGWVKSEQFIDAEFRRLVKKGRKHLVLEEILRFQAKGKGGDTIPVDLCHLGVLWVLDRDHDGRFTLDDLIALASMCRRRSRCYQSFEYSAQLQGFCSLQLWQAMAAPNGRETYVNWVCALLMENSGERRRFWRYGTQQYLHVDTLEALYHLLRVHDTLGVDFQGFFDLLQRVGEERRLMDLRDEEQDDWVPLGVVRDFVAGTARGAQRLMGDICPAEDLPADLNDL